MTELFLIRHGETAWTRQKRYQGHTDMHLTPYGRRQARLLARRLLTIKFDAVYSSPLKRARETAAMLASATGTRLRIESGLKEIFFGDWEGHSAQELIQKKDPRFLDWSRGRFVRPPGGEAILEFRKRVRAVLKKILRRHPSGRLALVTHGGPVKIMLFEMLKLPMGFWWVFRVEPASLSRLHVAKGFCQVVLWNDLSHLQ